MPEFLAPLPLMSVAVLALNDHVLKARFPGLVTGKLSDLAGCFLLPLFLSALLAIATRWPLRMRLVVGAVSTTLFFGAMKVSQPAADAVAATLAWIGRPVGLAGGPILADPTDLVALALVPLAGWYGSSRARGCPPADDRSGRPWPDPEP